MTIIELCRLKKEDYDDEKQMKMRFFAFLFFFHLAGSGEAGFLSGL